MPNVALYARSTKDRADVSVESQVQELEAEAQKNGETVSGRYIEETISAKTADRPEFQRMISDAKAGQVQKVYCYDTSRFSRSREDAAIYKALLRKQGVELVFLKLPKTDSYIDTVIEGMMEVFDEFHSTKSKHDALRGMRQNIRRGFRAGGRAPYGYRLKRHTIGKNVEGKDITKTTLEPDPDTSEIVKEYLERRARQETRMAILRDFFVRGISSPSGNVEWRASSGMGIEENALTYAGHTMFMREAERVGGRRHISGQRLRSKDEWIMQRNTHPAIISEETAEKILQQREEGRAAYPKHPVRARKYLLTGLVFCGNCGAHYYGNTGRYACKRRKELGTCRSRQISAQALEDRVLEEFKNTLLSGVEWPPMNQPTKRDKPSGIEQQLRELDRKQKRLMDLYMDDRIPAEIIGERTAELEEQRKRLEALMEKDLPSPWGTKEENAEAWKDYESGDIAKQRDILARYIERIILHPKDYETDVVIVWRE